MSVRAAFGRHLTLSRTAYRHPDDNAFIERVFRTLKEEAIRPFRRISGHPAHEAANVPTRHL